MSRPPVHVRRPRDGEVAAEFNCPFCSGKAYYGHHDLIRAFLGETGAETGVVGMAHAKPSCETFKQMSAEEFRDACLARIRQ